MAKDQKQDKQKKNVHGRWNLYETAGGLKRKNKFCPKCKSFLANHKDRFICGHCGYMESVKK